jgi:hypothetical protein
LGGSAGIGVDLQMGRSWMLGASAGYNFMSDLEAPNSPRDNYSGFEMGVSLSWLFGKGEPRY